MANDGQEELAMQAFAVVFSGNILTQQAVTPFWKAATSLLLPPWLLNCWYRPSSFPPVINCLLDDWSVVVFSPTAQDIGW